MAKARKGSLVGLACLDVSPLLKLPHGSVIDMWSVRTSPSLQVKRKAADFGKQGTEQTGDDFNPDGKRALPQRGIWLCRSYGTDSLLGYFGEPVRRHRPEP